MGSQALLSGCFFFQRRSMKLFLQKSVNKEINENNNLLFSVLTYERIKVLLSLAQQI